MPRLASLKLLGKPLPSKYTQIARIKLTGYECSIYLDQAMRGFRMHDCYKAELSRTFYRLSKTQEAEGDEVGAMSSLVEAQTLYKIAVNADKAEDTLTAADFDDAIPISSR